MICYAMLCYTYNRPGILMQVEILRRLSLKRKHGIMRLLSGFSIKKKERRSWEQESKRKEMRGNLLLVLIVVEMKSQ